MTPSVVRQQTAPTAGDGIAERAAEFCSTAPYRQGEYAKRNWGGPLHSLCSYQGKLKPSIAHFLISWFTEPGQRVLDPLAGVGTIPLEARRQARIGLASDLSPMADAVCRAKLESVTEMEIWKSFRDLEEYIAQHADDDLSAVDVDFGLNGPIRQYFHEATLREIVLARQYFLNWQGAASAIAARDVLKSSVMHILHGNRPYALSRRSHPITPFAPTGPTIYRPVLDALRERLNRIVPHLLLLESVGSAGASQLADFRSVDPGTSVDAVVTSPPFTKSVRFWSSNWMRLWFAGWAPGDFKVNPKQFLEVEQRTDFNVYRQFAESMTHILKPRGLLVMHLGETATLNMATAIEPMLEPFFDIHFAGRESVLLTESHGLRDKGATIAHWYVFATAKT